LGEIRQNRENLYLPEAVDVCIRLFESGRFCFDMETEN
jgi:hypothetical protein